MLLMEVKDENKQAGRGHEAFSGPSLTEPNEGLRPLQKLYFKTAKGL